jgi:F-type H+-transporting ATPase subunit gamma
VTHRRDLERHRDSLGEIAEILSAGRQIVESIEEAAADFLSFERQILPESRQGASVLLLIGSERGFCGNFNHALVDELETLRRASKPGRPRLLVVGRKLHSLLEDDEDVVAYIDGASVAEDVAGILQSLVDELNTLQPSMTDLKLAGIYHTAAGIRTDALLPPFERQERAAPRYANPPLLNVPPADFLLDLIEHYLLAAMNDMLYTSLMVENNRRVSHLERAVQHIEDESGELTRKCRALRQEEIIEEIEVILLSASGIDDNGGTSYD